MLEVRARVFREGKFDIKMISFVGKFGLFETPKNQVFKNVSWSCSHLLQNILKADMKNAYKTQKLSNVCWKS